MGENQMQNWIVDTSAGRVIVEATTEIDALRLAYACSQAGWNDPADRVDLRQRLDGCFEYCDIVNEDNDCIPPGEEARLRWENCKGSRFDLVADKQSEFPAVHAIIRMSQWYPKVKFVIFQNDSVEYLTTEKIIKNMPLERITELRRCGAQCPYGSHIFLFPK